MIDFRYHLVSIIAVFLALAIGVVLGSSALRDPLIQRVDNVAATLRGTNEDLRTQVSSLRHQVEADQRLVDQVAPEVVDGRLAGERVVVVETPGAGQEVRRDVVTMVEKAGGTVTGRVAVQKKYLDGRERGVIGALTTRLQPAGMRLPEASVYERSGAVLAEALMTDPGNKGTGEGETESGGTGSKTVLSGFETAGYVSVEKAPKRPATLAVVLAPITPAEPENAEQTGGTLTALARAFDQRGKGTVVAGTKPAASEGGLVYYLRGSRSAAEAVSTVDFADTVTGQVATAVALAMETRDETGHYGIGPRAKSYLPPFADQQQSSGSVVK